MERDAYPMADGAAQHEKMPNEMHVGDFVHDKENDADRVGNAFRKKYHETRMAERLAELREGEYAEMEHLYNAAIRQLTIKFEILNDEHPAHNEITR